MSVIVTRAGKGTPMTNLELDTNFTNLNTDKASAGANNDITSLGSLVSINGGQLAGMRNVIINGDMRIDQRNAGSAVAVNNTAMTVTDRFSCTASGGVGTGTISGQRVLDGPPGFPYSLKYTVTNAKVPAATDQNYILQAVEADNCGVFAYGSVAPKTAALSFWVKSTIAGLYGGMLRNGPNGGTQRSYLFTYTVNAANTWEYKTVIVPGDNLAIPPGNGLGLTLLFDCGSGINFNGVVNTWQAGNFWRTAACVNLISTLNAALQITGVQLEAGPVATPFENRSLGLELTLCQRYYQVVGNSMRITAAAAGSYLQSNANFLPMRAGPTSALISQATSNVNGVALFIGTNYACRLEAQAVAAGDAYVINRIDSLTAEL